MPKKIRHAIQDSNRNGQSEFRVPKDPIAKKVYLETFGRLAAQEKILEVKASKFGRIASRDKFSKLFRLSKEGYTNFDRGEIYTKAMSLYEQNEFIRPAINLLSSAIFSQNSPDFRGTRDDLIKMAWRIVDHNELNFGDLAREGELAGDVYLWYEPNGDQTRIWSLDAGRTSSILDNGDVRRILRYELKTEGETTKFPKERIQHLKFNSTTTSQYGKSSIRQVLYWLDVIDNLIEKQWLRGAQYYSNPLIAIIGVPGPYQATVKNQIEAEQHRQGKSWVLPPDTDIKTPDFTGGFPMNELVSWVFRMITIALEIPITLFGTADASSRGSAFFAMPRFELTIQPKREVWRIGLRSLMISIFRSTGTIGLNEVLTRKEFNIGFNPITSKDVKEVGELMRTYRELLLISKKSAREFIGLDHSNEEEFIEAEGDDPILLGIPKEKPDDSEESKHGVGSSRKKRKKIKV